MTITERKIFVTEDGKEHRTVQAAQEWEMVVKLTRELASGTVLNHSEAEETAVWLLRNYNVTPKEG